jgi:hypothetical protein
MLTLAVMKMVMKYVKRAIGMVRMLNRARVDKAFPTSNGVSSRVGYNTNVYKKQTRCVCEKLKPLN